MTDGKKNSQRFRSEHVFQRFRHLAIQKINYLRCFFHLRLTWARLCGVKTYFFPLKTKSWGQCWIDTTPKVAKYFWTEKIPWVRSKQFGSFFFSSMRRWVQFTRKHVNIDSKIVAARDRQSCRRFSFVLAAYSEKWPWWVTFNHSIYSLAICCDSAKVISVELPFSRVVPFKV